MINFKAATGTRISDTEELVKRVEDVVRKVVAPGDLKIIASNIGINPDISAIFNPNSGNITATSKLVWPMARRLAATNTWTGSAPR